MVDINKIETIFGLVFTALIMTIFEIVFAYIVVFPGIDKSVENTMNKIEGESSNLPQKELKAVIQAISNREDKTISTVNAHSKIFAGSLVFVLLSLTLYFGYIMKKEKSNVFIPVLQSMITICILISFQYNFYLMGKKYGFQDPKDLIPHIVDDLCKDVPELDETTTDEQINTLISESSMELKKLISENPMTVEKIKEKAETLINTVQEANMIPSNYKITRGDFNVGKYNPVQKSDRQ